MAAGGWTSCLHCSQSTGCRARQLRIHQPLAGLPSPLVSCFLRMSHNEIGVRNGVLPLAALCSWALGARGGFLLPILPYSSSWQLGEPLCPLVSSRGRCVAGQVSIWYWAGFSVSLTKCSLFLLLKSSPADTFFHSISFPFLCIINLFSP